MFFNQKKNQTAFTLIELLLYVGIFSVLMLTVSAFLNVVIQAKEKRQVISEVEYQGANIAYFISHNIKAASGITSPILGANNSTLTLSSADSTRNPTVFKLINGAIAINLANGSDIVLNNNQVTASNFICYNFGKTGTSGSINCQFTLSASDASNRHEYSYTKKFNVSVSRRY